MERMGLEQMLVSDPDSIWYLTGYDVFPFERLYAFYLRKDGQHKLFLNKLFPVPEAPYEQVWFSDTDDYLAILANAVAGQSLSTPMSFSPSTGKRTWAWTRTGPPGFCCP